MKTLLPLLLGCCLSLAHAAPLPRVVVIIDDVGNDLYTGREATALPPAVDLAVLPHTPHGRELAGLGNRRGHEIMLHLPMSNLEGRALGPGALTPAMPRAQMVATLDGDLAAVPHVRGVNNHMGSQLTEQPRPMAWLMQALHKRRLFFVDSRTTAATVAEREAGRYGVPHLRRHVFLDNSRDPQAIEAQLDKLLTRARQQGFAVGIGHPYPETMQVLDAQLPGLLLRGVLLVPASSTLAARREPPALVEHLPFPADHDPLRPLLGRNPDSLVTLTRH